MAEIDTSGTNLVRWLNRGGTLVLQQCVQTIEYSNVVDGVMTTLTTKWIDVPIVTTPLVTEQ